MYQNVSEKPHTFVIFLGYIRLLLVEFVKVTASQNFNIVMFYGFLSSLNLFGLKAPTNQSQSKTDMTFIARIDGI